MNANTVGSIRAGPRRLKDSGAQRQQDAQTRVAGEQPSRSAERGQQQTLDERLPQQPAAAGAERQPQRRLLRARRRPRDQQPRHVDARDHQQDADAGEQRQQRPAISRVASACSATA